MAEFAILDRDGDDVDAGRSAARYVLHRIQTGLIPWLSGLKLDTEIIMPV